jgi:hypothetical protein
MFLFFFVSRQWASDITASKMTTRYDTGVFDCFISFDDFRQGMKRHDKVCQDKLEGDRVPCSYLN